MLKEEKELRKFYSVAYPSEAAEIKRDFKQMLTALIRAVREDCAEVAEAHKEKYSSNELFVTAVIVSLTDDIAAAIRGRK